MARMTATPAQIRPSPLIALRLAGIESGEEGGWAGGAAGKIYVTKNGGRLWIEQRSGIEQDISDIVFLNSTDGFAVGDQGKLLSTASAGASWKIENISSKNKLERIVFTGNTGFVVGFGGTILKYQL